MDTNHNDNARGITRNTWSTLHLKDLPPPTAIIAGGFELGVDFWRQRNVAARLIAVAMGAAQWTPSGTEFIKQYNETCLGLGIHMNYCNLQGYTMTSQEDFHNDHRRMWKRFKAGICERLTVEEMKLMFRSNTQKRHSLEGASFGFFWDNFGEDAIPQIPASVAGMLATTTENVSSHHNKQESRDVKIHAFGNYAIPMVGVIFDCVNSESPLSQIQSMLKEFVGPLRFNLMQLRLLDDHGIAFRPKNLAVLGSTASEQYEAEEYTKLIKFAAEEFGISTIPEISVSTHSGGWVDSGFMASCPKLLCDRGKGMVTDIENPSLMPVIFTLLSELRSLFNTSPYLHLGSDDRIGASQGCLQETQEYSDPMQSLALFEEKLTKLIEMLGIRQDQILRWDNGNSENYSDRTGNITHFRAHNPFILPQVKPGDKFFASVNLLSQSPWMIYKHTRELVELNPQAILGEIREFSPQMMKKKNIGLRLAAFALGLQRRDGAELEKKLFQSEVVSTCKAANFTNCDGSEGMNVPTIINVEQTSYRMEICNQYTFENKVRAVKPDIM